MPADGRTQHRYARAAEVDPLRRGVRDRLDHPALGGGHQQAAAGEPGGRRRIAEGDDRDAGVVDRGQLGAGGRCEAGEQRGRLGRGRGDHHRVGVQRGRPRRRPGHQPEAGRGGLDPAHRQAEPDLGGGGTRDRRGQRAEAAAQGGERRAGHPSAGLPGLPRGGVPGTPSGGSQRRRPAGQRGGHAGHGRVQGQQVGPAGVDPAEQRVDQPVHHLPAEPTPDVLSDRHVAVQRLERARRLRGDLGECRRVEHARRAQRLELGRHPEHRAGWQRAGTPADDHPGGRRDRVRQLPAQPDFCGQRNALRGAGQERLRALVHRQPAELGHPQLAAEPVGALQHGHPQVRRAVAAQRVRRSEAGDPAADHDHPRAGPRRPAAHVHRVHPARDRIATSR